MDLLNSALHAVQQRKTNTINRFSSNHVFMSADGKLLFVNILGSFAIP